MINVIHFYYIPGLFHGAICHSGVAISSSGFCSNIRNRAFQLGEALGLKTDDSEELIHFLMGFSPKSLVEKMSEALTDTVSYNLKESNNGTIYCKFHQYPILVLYLYVKL